MVLPPITLFKVLPHRLTIRSSYAAARSRSRYLGKHSDDILMELHLELADLGVKGEGVKEHGADEGYVGRLAGERERAGLNIRLDIKTSQELQNCPSYCLN